MLRRVLVRFLLAVGICFVIYFGLVIPSWPGVREGYRDLYLWTGRTLFQYYGDEGQVNFEAGSEKPETDAVIHLGKRGVKDGPRVGINTGRIGYAPTAALIAFVLATPIPWSRRWRALVFGLVLVHLFVISRIWIQLLFWYSEPTPAQLYDPGPFWGEFLGGFYDFYCHAPTCSFLGPAFIWLLVCIRREDVARIREMVQGLKGETDDVDADDAKAGRTGARRRRRRRRR